jgi:uncharacterized SAM-binding protein YcdF (DUF218 family)
MKNVVVLPVIAFFFVIVSVGFWKFDSLLEAVWTYLVVDEKPVSSDVIIVLSGDLSRVDQGVRLYYQGYAPRIILSGSSSPEMEKKALSLGVPKKDLIPEVKSRTTFENAYYSAEIMRAQGFLSAIVVTSAYHTRRSNIIFSRFFKDWRLTVCAVPYDTSISSSWWKHHQTAGYVISEYLKMVYLDLIEIPGHEISFIPFRLYDLSPT